MGKYKKRVGDTSGSQGESESVSSSSFSVRLFRAGVLLLLFAILGNWVYKGVIEENSEHNFRLGLDLSGGSHLVYQADVSNIDALEVPSLMDSLKNVIERRINVFGVSEPVIYVESSSVVSAERTERLVVELPGITDISEAIDEIGRTPLLEFKLVNPEATLSDSDVSKLEKDEAGNLILDEDAEATLEKLKQNEPYIATELTGRYLESAQIGFSQSGQGVSSEPLVAIKFTDEGGKIFADITRNNIGKPLAIFLDGEIISSPVIREAITGGSATIDGGFSVNEAKELAKNLSLGALPVPIELVSTQTIGASLGQEILSKSILAGEIGLGLVILFMILWYRLPGMVSGIALIGYSIIMLALFQYIPVTLTAVGLAGFIISIGMAIDANILVFERMKEEFALGKDSVQAADEGFKRAWTAIRDANITSILAAIILYWFGSSLVKGFALVFGVGVLVSMFSALFVTRNLLLVLPKVRKEDKNLLSFLLGTGWSK